MVPENKLEAPEKKALVKPTPLSETPSITDWFAKLVPFAIKEVSKTKYKKKKKKKAREGRKKGEKKEEEKKRGRERRS